MVKYHLTYKKDYMDLNELVLLCASKGFDKKKLLHIYDSPLSDDDTVSYTLCRLQKWLREEKGIRLVSLPYKMGDPLGIVYIWMIQGLESSTKYTMDWVTYEDALKDGIEYSLKLI